MVTSHAQREAFQLVLNAIPTTQLVLPLLALAVTIVLARWSFVRVGVVVLSPLRLLGVSAALLLVVTLCAARVVRPKVEYATTGPERTTYRSWLLARREKNCLRDPACAETMNRLDETIRRKLTRFGMRVNPSAKLPLLKPVVYRRALPFAMTTVDLHPPFNLTTVPEVIPGEDGRLFNIVHSTDDAFGEFWRWFKQSRYVDNTIVVVTADHAVLPKPEYMQLRGPEWEKSFFDRIPLFIHAPGLALPRTWQPAVASSVDLLPTILHMLAINEPNPFEGVSLFDDRQAKQGMLGDHTYLFFSNQLDARGQRVLDNFTVADCPVDAQPERTDMLTRCEQQRWHAWKLRLIDQRRIWAGGPAVAALRSP